MEFLLEDIQPSALLGPTGAVVANVPTPARYALHKLLVFGQRSGTYAAKSRKDLVQAAHVLAYLTRYRPRELDRAWKDLVSRGRQWLTGARQGVHALDAAFPELAASDRLRFPGVRKSTKRQ